VRRDLIWLIVIIALVGVSVWVSLNPDYPIQPGLDLQGGLQVLLEADLPADELVTAEQMSAVRQIVSQRVNALGVAEPLVQIEGERRVLVELPGISNPEQAIDLIQGTALLEFVDTGNQSLPPGLCIRTTLNEGQPSPCELEDSETLTDTNNLAAPSYETILTGALLADAGVESRPPEILVHFRLTPEGAEIFETHTREHLREFLTIVLDKRVISSPQIEAVIGEEGTISGQFTLDEAQNLALQLRYGSLPIPLRIESTRQIGATLGAVSVEASIRAGTIGLIIVLLFMIVYYRLPGLLAAVALLIYALLNFALFKWIGVTLTLPAITGFLLSTGMAVDANILVFERMKEELRKGGLLADAIDLGFDRAWNSIRDANVATLVICLILWTFGRNFGASTVVGFAITLFIGVMISMFTAVIVTRTFVRLTLSQAGNWFKRRGWLLGT
jgi:protein-export membrane protein SecD